MSTLPSSRGWIWVRTLGFTLFLPGLILVYAPYLWIVGAERVSAAWPPGAVRAPAVLRVALGFRVYAVCAARFVREGLGTPAPWDAPRLLVTGGLYRWTRNPMYVGLVVTLLGEAWLFASGALMVYALAIAAMFHARVLLYEEPTLHRLFGAPFEAYCGRVRRWGVV